MNQPRNNIAASVRQRLANLAKARGIEFQRILVLYAVERLLCSEGAWCSMVYKGW